MKKNNKKRKIFTSKKIKKKKIQIRIPTLQKLKIRPENAGKIRKRRA
jgi:hypothetical protein